MEKVKDNIEEITDVLRNKQLDEGNWKFLFDSGPMTDAHMIILLRNLNDSDEQLVRQLVERLISLQQPNGVWTLYSDETDGNLSATVEAYTALLFSGYYTIEDENMLKAAYFIRSKGGLSALHPTTKLKLALNNIYPWPKNPIIPPFVMLLPKKFPINFSDFNSYAKVHFAPFFITASKKFSIKNQHTPDLSHLIQHSQRKSKFKKKALLNLLSLFKRLPFHLYLNDKALLKAEQYILHRIEGDGTLYNYATATYLMIYALLAVGYKQDSPMVQEALGGLKSFLYRENNYIHVQNSPSTIWDTALVSYVLKEANLKSNYSSIKLAANYLLSKQHNSKSESSDQQPHVSPGGWGFSEYNKINPDIDDTQSVLRTIQLFSDKDRNYKDAWNRGVNWLLAMQNDDGGWSAFNRNTNKQWLTDMPIVNMEDAAIDPSSADITGRTLEFLGETLRLDVHHPRVKAAVNWLIGNQKPDGSWSGRWGVSYIYGTWAAVTGLCSVGLTSEHPTIQKAEKWLISIQQSDGGWGESCRSDIEKKYCPLSFSIPSQTSWALDTLVAVNAKRIPSIDRGIKCLVDKKWDSLASSYPTGAGLPGQFYIYYQSYNYIWPLLALSHYYHKYS